MLPIVNMGTNRASRVRRELGGGGNHMCMGIWSLR
jgi:hypothetical protein